MINNVSIRTYFHNDVSLLQKGTKVGTGVKAAKKEKARNDEDFEDENFFLCNTCKYPIAKKSDRIKINDKNDHFFANPHGYIFHIGCFIQANGCIIYGEETSYFSWFGGYTWRIALCGRCGSLMGWFFHSKDSQFFGIILDNIN